MYFHLFYNPKSLLKQIKKIGEEEAIKLCQSNDQLGGFLTDTALFMNKQSLVQRIIVSIDLNNVSKYINSDNKELIITHHPVNIAQQNYFKIFYLYKDILKKFINSDKQDKRNYLVSLGLQRLKNYSSSINPFIHDYLWEIKNTPVICVHTIADICVNNYLNLFIPTFMNAKLRDFIKFLSNIPAIRTYRSYNLYPYVVLGALDNICGNIFIDMLNGVVEVPECLEFLYHSNIHTIVTMHITEAYLQQARNFKFNLINMTHIPADNLGMNLLLDRVFKSKNIDIISCSGFKRIKSKKTNFFI